VTLLATSRMGLALAGRETGHVHAGGEHDHNGSRPGLTPMPASGPVV
jgi:hypothetical protein